MKTILTTAALVLAVAGPAMAQSQLERSVGADAGEYTVSELAQIALNGSNDGANERNDFFGNSRINFSANDIHNGVAADVFKRIADEQSGNF